MTQLDEMVAAFECLWEAKLHMQRAVDSKESISSGNARAILNEIGRLRDQLENELVAQVQSK